VLVDLDADGAQRPEELPAGFARVSPPAVDVVVASKYVPGAVVSGRPWLRRLGSRALSGMLRELIKPELRDYTNSYRFYSRRAAEALLAFPIRYQGPVHVLEMMAIWMANGFTVAEMPTHTQERAGGRSKVVARDVLIELVGVLDVAIGYRLGRYRLGD
jgi:hypothetical protein